MPAGRARNLLALALCALLLPLAACGPDSDAQDGETTASDLTAGGPDAQFAGGFAPHLAPWGGFGGAACKAKRTPVVFFHGNHNRAQDWDDVASTGVPSVYQALRADGYQDCELFGINWLSPDARVAQLLNTHDAGKAGLAAGFISDVLAYTKAAQVDVIGHSMGVTVALHGISRAGLWPKVRRFISISGAMRGLDSCFSVGFANPAFAACFSQSLTNPDVFGFYPDSPPAAPNPRMGPGGFETVPAQVPATAFYSIGSGIHDGFTCITSSPFPSCSDTNRFDKGSNVRAQLDVGSGSTSRTLDYDLSDGSIYVVDGGDADGVGHIRAKSNTGRVQRNMLRTECRGAACCAGYAGRCL